MCAYLLTVEGQFICPLLSEVDDHGLFHVQESMRLFDPLPLSDSGSDEVDQSRSGSTLGQSLVESEEAIKSEESQTDSRFTSEQSQSHSGSTSEHSQSHSDSPSEQSQSHSDSKSGQKAAHT